MHRLLTISRIESRAEELRQSCSATAWLENADPMVAEVHCHAHVSLCGFVVSQNAGVM